MSNTVQISIPQEAYDKLALSVWSVIQDSPYIPEIYKVLYKEEVFMGDNKVKVVIENPYKDGMMTRTLTLKALVRAYLSLGEQYSTHCGGCHILYDPDACSGDMILQQALFGEQVYG